ncbi:hypothetical protein [Streptomyces sp. NBC_01294]|uniref:hypothetical protein n=1 Tax=Streptomyces sp. NBC_01294 TaxID=2903815 RepID=UPI002DDC60D0|nr:hypothetical protein [Streptomyces sp. NBC_01294]WRZ58339.1 collagen-like protein [Streptomyces sp. NBC_01294]
MSPENRTKSTLGPLPRRSSWLAGGTLASLALVMVGISSPAFAAAESIQAAETVTAASPTGGGDKCKPHKKPKHDPREERSAAGPQGGGGDECEGKRGPTGPRGPKGKPGEDGIDGADGATGATGAPGADGATGATGAPGVDGATGATGAPGADGATGATGATGVSECVDIDAVWDNNAREFRAALPGDTNAYAGIRRLTGPNAGTWLWYDLTTNDAGQFPDGACSISIGHQANVLAIDVVTTEGVIWETSCDVNPGDGTLTCDGVWSPLTSQPEEGDPNLRRAAATAPVRPMDPNHLPKQLKQLK